MRKSWGSVGARQLRMSIVTLGLTALLGACSPADDDGEGDGSGGSGEPVVNPTYCDAQIVIADKCLRCHSDGGDVIVPFNLETYEEVSDQQERIARAVETEFMPYTDLKLDPEVEELTSVEKNLIIDWVDAGAPTGGCD